MVLLTEPRAATWSDGRSWESIQKTSVFSLERQKPKPLSSLMGNKSKLTYRIITNLPPMKEVATADTEEEMAQDADILSRFIAGIMPAEAELVPQGVRDVIAEIGTRGDAAADGTTAGGSEAATIVAALQKEWKSAEVLKQLEPWALQLMENSDKLRYVVYALKVATSAGADLSTGGMGGEEVVQLCFISVDTAVVSSWLTWFATSLLDNSEASNVVRQTLAINFDGGPRTIAAQADAICASMRPEDVEPVTKLAMSLKRRVAVLVGDICSLFMKNDMAIGGVAITELLIRMIPQDASEGLRKLVAWYEVIPQDYRGRLEDRERLGSLLTSVNGKVKSAVMYEYDKPLSRKAIDCGVRGVVLLPIPFSAQANLAYSAAIGANVGKESCESVFATVDERMPEIAAAMQKALSVAFGTLILLAHCADRAEGKTGNTNGSTNGSTNATATGSSNGASAALGWTATAALEVLPVVLAAQKKSSSASASGTKKNPLESLIGAFSSIGGRPKSSS